MPELDGLETTRRIRALVGPEVPIIIISAYDASEIELEMQEAGANGFIAKPLYLSALYNTLKDMTQPHNMSSVQPNTNHQLAGLRILLVKDNLLHMEIAEELLDMHGVIIETATNGQEGLEKFLQSKPVTTEQKRKSM